MKEKNEVEELPVPDLKIYHRATIIKMISQKDRQIDQLNRTESPETDLHRYSQLIFNKGAKAIKWSKDSVFNK